MLTWTDYVNLANEDPFPPVPDAGCIVGEAGTPGWVIWSPYAGAGDDRFFDKSSNDYRTRLNGLVYPGFYSTSGSSDSFTWLRNASEVYAAYSSIAGGSGAPGYSGGVISSAARADTSMNDCELKVCQGTSSIFNTEAFALDISVYESQYTFEHSAQAGCLPLLYQWLFPTIDYDITITFDATEAFRTRWEVEGVHDLFPWYELYVTPSEDGFARTLYQFQPALQAPEGIIVGLPYSTLLPSQSGAMNHPVN
jgi:hypothetical protein